MTLIFCIWLGIHKNIYLILSIWVWSAIFSIIGNMQESAIWLDWTKHLDFFCILIGANGNSKSFQLFQVVNSSLWQSNSLHKTRPEQLDLLTPFFV